MNSLAFVTVSAFFSNEGVWHVGHSNVLEHGGNILVVTLTRKSYMC